MKKGRRLLGQLLLVCICTLTLVVTTFSWSAPLSQTGTQMQLKKSMGIRGKGCTMVTYSGKANSQGAIYFDEDNPITDFSTGHNQLLSEQNNKAYFRTKIKGAAADSNVSLYIQEIAFTASLESQLYLGVHNLLNTYDSFAKIQAANGNIEVASNTFVSAGGEVVLDWYISGENISGETAVVLKNPYLVYR